MAKRVIFDDMTRAPLTVAETADKYGISGNDLSKVKRFVLEYVGRPSKTQQDRVRVHIVGRGSAIRSASKRSPSAKKK
jgi:hypothetical protein